MNPDKNHLEPELAPLKDSDQLEKREFAAVIESASAPLAGKSSATTSDELMLQSEACVRLGEIFNLNAKHLFDKARELSANDPDIAPRGLARLLLSYLASAGTTSALIRSLAAEMLEEGYGKY